MLTQDPYLAHRRFIAPAWARPEISRIFLMLFGFELALMLTPGIMINLTPTPIAQAFTRDLTAFGTILGFASFGLTLGMFHVLGLLLADRGIGTMIGPWVSLKRDFWNAAIAVILVLIAVEAAPPFIELSEIVEVRNTFTWALWLVPAFAAIAIQSFTEEVVYRGYLQQQLAVLSSRPIIWMGMPSFLFGLGHYFNGLGPSDGVLWAIWAGLLGLACADLTARTGNIGAAVGLHAANNVFAAVIISSVDWPGSGLALYLYPAFDPAGYDYSLDLLLAPWAVIEVLISALNVLVMWLGARIALRR